MSIFVELWQFMRARKKYWLLPIVMMMALFGGLIVLTQGTAVAPFIYTVFSASGTPASTCLSGRRGPCLPVPRTHSGK